MQVLYPIEGDLLPLEFPSYDGGTGASITMTDLATSDIEIFKDGGATTRASDNGYTLQDTDGTDVAGITGYHGIIIDLNDNSDAGFFEVGSWYTVVIASVTIDGQTVNLILGKFRILSATRGMTGTALPDAAADGSGGVPISDAGGADIDQLIADAAAILVDSSELQSVLSAGIIARTNNPTLNALLGVADTAGEDVPGQTAFETADEVLTGGTHNVTNSLGRRIRQLQEAGGYTGGFVYVDTVNGTAGTTDFENGVDTREVDNLPDANTLAGSIGLSRFSIAPGSSIAFVGGQTNQIFIGRDWTLALGVQDITGIFVVGSEVTGIATATGTYRFEECDLGAVTLDNDGHFERCSLGGTFTIGQAGTFTFHNCFTESAASITIDFAALGATAVHLFQFDGEINFTNMAAGDSVHITGAGTITTTTCTGGTIEHDGFFEYTDAGGNVTEVQSDIKVEVDKIALADAGAGAAGSMIEEIENRALASVCTEARLAELDAGNIPASVDAIPTTAMRGTDNGALAIVCSEGRLAELDGVNMPADLDIVVLAVADLYHADIQLTIDEANTQDEYTVTWFKNGIRVTSGITTPLIQVVNRADGTDLVASTAMTQIGTTGSFRYDEATNRITNGEAVVIIATATIDGSARSFTKVGARDSVAA